jgi:surfeit locus 1 family protein
MRVRERLILIVAAVVAAGCIRLGFWQLDRLEQRRAHNAAVLARFGEPPITLDSLTEPGAAPFRRVLVSGSYDHSRELLLANRSRRASPGVHILTPLRRRGSDTAVLIVRGWVYSPDAAHTGTERWREGSAAGALGYVRPFDAPVRRSRLPLPGNSVRDLDFVGISARMPYRIAPYVVVLLSDRDETRRAAVSLMETGGSDHPVRLGAPALGEGNHLSYAVQWFSFAAIAVIGAAVLFLRGRRGTLAYDPDFNPAAPAAR